MKRRAPYRNEVKTRFDDPTYDAFLRYQQLHGIESESAALLRLARTALLGVIGMLPSEFSGVSDDPAHIGTRS
jgi:hypothetical protein